MAYMESLVPKAKVCRHWSHDGEEFTKVRRATTSVKFQLVWVPRKHGQPQMVAGEGSFCRMKMIKLGLNRSRNFQVEVAKGTDPEKNTPQIFRCFSDLILLLLVHFGSYDLLSHFHKILSLSLEKMDVFGWSFCLTRWWNPPRASINKHIYAKETYVWYDMIHIYWFSDFRNFDVVELFKIFTLMYKPYFLSFLIVQASCARNRWSWMGFTPCYRTLIVNHRCIVRSRKRQINNWDDNNIW